MSKKLTHEEFVEIAAVIHGEKYNYSKYMYTGMNNSFSFCCNNCSWVSTLPYAWQHTKRGLGCQVCGDYSPKNYSTELFVARFKYLNPDKRFYDMSNFTYINSITKSTVTCNNGHTFQISPANLLQGRGCKKCSIDKHNKNQRIPYEEAKRRALSIYGSTYTYNESTYVDFSTKMEITCNKHGVFYKSMEKHCQSYNPQGCPSCTSGGFNKNKPAILYLLSINGYTNLYKIGITNRTVEERFSLLDRGKINILKQKIFENGLDCYSNEQAILENFKDYIPRDLNILESGNTELLLLKEKQLEYILSNYYT